MTEGRFTYNDFILYITKLKNLNAGEGAVAAKRADIAKVLALIESLLQRTGITYANGLGCGDTGLSDAANCDIWVQTTKAEGATISRGIIQVGQRFSAVANIGGVWVTWKGTAYADNKIRIVGANITSPSAASVPAITYSSLCNNQNLHVYCLPMTGGAWINEEDLARSITGINLATFTMESNDPSGGAFYAADDNAETVLANLITAFQVSHDATGNLLASAVKPAMMDRTATGTMRIKNLVAGGMETLGISFISSAQRAPFGWIASGAPTNLERSNTHYHSGSQAMKIVTTGADQGAASYIEDYASYANLPACLSCWVYTTQTSVKLFIVDGAGTHRTVITGITPNTWTKITATYTVSAGFISAGIVSTAADTMWVDAFMVNGGDKALDYIPSRFEDLIEQGGLGYGAEEEFKNLMLNADMAIQPAPSGAGDYPPLGWQLGSVVSGGFVCQADATNGLYSGNATLLKLYDNDEIFSDCFAPDVLACQPYLGKYVTFEIWIKAHGTPGTDPVTIGIQDTATMVSFQNSYVLPAAYASGNPIYVTALIDATWTNIHIYIRNTAGTANFCQFYLGGVSVHLGQVPIAWRPGANHQEHDFTLTAAGLLATPSYPRIGSIVTSATVGVPVKGKVIGASWDIYEGTAPTVSAVDKWQLSISDQTGAEALPALGVYDVALTKHCQQGCYTIPNANRPIMAAGEGTGARVTQKCTGVAGTPGQDAVIDMKVYTIK